MTICNESTFSQEKCKKGLWISLKAVSARTKDYLTNLTLLRGTPGGWTTTPYQYMQPSPHPSCCRNFQRRHASWVQAFPWPWCSNPLVARGSKRWEGHGRSGRKRTGCRKQCAEGERSEIYTLGKHSTSSSSFAVWLKLLTVIWQKINNGCQIRGPTNGKRNFGTNIGNILH